MPFSSFEEALKRPDNKALAAQLATAIKDVAPAAAGQQLARCRDLAMQVRRDTVVVLRRGAVVGGLAQPWQP